MNPASSKSVACARHVPLESEKDENTQALHDFNEMVLADKRKSNVLLPIRDGLMVVRKES